MGEAEDLVYGPVSHTEQTERRGARIQSGYTSQAWLAGNNKAAAVAEAAAATKQI